MELWIAISIAAAFMQNLRSMLQKHLKGVLSTLGATFARFVWAAPLAIGLAIVLVAQSETGLPEMSGRFFLFAAIGGLSQIFATAVLLTLFSFRNFAVGVAFSKTETVQAIAFGLIILGDVASPSAFLGILISMVGVVLLSIEPGQLFCRGLVSRATLLGVGSGALFAISGVAYRAASLSLNDDFLLTAAVTLAFATTMQTLVMWVWLSFREPGQVAKVFAHWKITSIVGLVGMLGSLGWFTAMTLQNAAYVKAVGQVELIFTFAASYLVFGERSTKREIGGIVLIAAGILMLVLV